MSETTFDDVTGTWDQVARDDGKVRAAIHPSGALSDEAYEASGLTQAGIVVDIASRYGNHITGLPVSVLDFGCGDGRVLRHLPREWRRVGADASSAMLNRLFGLDDEVETVDWDGRTEWTGEPIDVVVTLAVLIHHGWNDGADIVAMLATAMHPGSLLLLDLRLSDTPTERTDWTDVTTWHPEFLRGVAWSLGFDILDVPWPNVLRKR